MQNEQTGWDIIGDLHGCANLTKSLLDKLGYSFQQGKYVHAQNRKLAFVGDYFDRGNEIIQTLQLVQKLVQDGVAKIVLGNHETAFLMAYAKYGKTLFNNPPAILNSVNSTSLQAYAKRQADFYNILDWLLTQPLILELNDFRLAHASWDESLFKEFFIKYPTGVVNANFMCEAMQTNSFAHKVVEVATQGKIFDYPFDYLGMSSDGKRRRKFRTKFWLENPQTYGDVFFHPFAIPEEIFNLQLPVNIKNNLLHYTAEQKKLFVGHYWLSSEAKLLAPNICCVDYSAVKGGKLVAYRFSGETQLTTQNFVCVEA